MSARSARRTAGRRGRAEGCPVRIVASREVAAPAERVWEVVTDIEGSAAVLSAVDAIERLDDGVGFGEGTRWRETRTM
ncbi:MAG: SRPBCC family protein, partial [Nitriliruptoraceae bacterium]